MDRMQRHPEIAAQTRAGGPRSRAELTRLLLATVAVSCLVLGTGWPKDASAKDHVFVGVKKCKTCHKKEDIGNQYGVWLDAKHSKAFETLGGKKAAEWAAEAGVDDPQTDEKCLKCHVTAYGVPKELVDKRFDPTLGVQCESCHGAGKDYRKKKIMIDQDLAISKGLIYPPKEDGCRSCHNDDSPAWKPDRYTLADGTKVGFDFEQAVKAIEHPVPEGYEPSVNDDEEE
ncbi:MAG: multiheme c-type cytochrome [Myxococcota bacterium]